MNPLTEEERAEKRRRFWSAVRRRTPHFREAVLADARVALQRRDERWEFRSTADAVVQILRLMVVTDAFAAHVAYRGKARAQALQIPVLPRIAHRLAIMLAGVSIGDPVIVEAGVYIPHGQVVIDGITEIAAEVTVAPWVSIGRVQHEVRGPFIGRGARIGTGSALLGPITIGEGATIGANSVVLDDVAPGATVVGAPARPVPGRGG